MVRSAREFNDGLYNLVMNHKYIFSLMYNPCMDDEQTIKSQIVKISTCNLEWAEDKSSFVYVWGYPGPDFNYYDIDSYGKGWAFTRHEIIKAWKENII